jgi:hypothetical protein
MKRTYEDLKERSRERVGDKLHQVIAEYDGSARCVREVLRGLVAAADLGLEIAPFVREIGKRARKLQDVDQQKRGKLAG